jgi:hypothetical protein
VRQQRQPVPSNAGSALLTTRPWEQTNSQATVFGHQRRQTLNDTFSQEQWSASFKGGFPNGLQTKQNDIVEKIRMSYEIISKKAGPGKGKAPNNDSIKAFMHQDDTVQVESSS